MKLIDKSALVAEIERRKSQFMSQADNFHSLGMEEKRDHFAVLASNMHSILSFIDTLEVKEVDLEKEYKDFIKSDNGRSMFEIAKHFFELGLLLQTETNITFKYNIGESVREYKAQKGE